MIARVQMNPEKLLEFVYSGEVSHMGDQLFLLFDAADQYEVMGLVCIWYLELLYFNEIFRILYHKIIFLNSSFCSIPRSSQFEHSNIVTKVKMPLNFLSK